MYNAFQLTRKYLRYYLAASSGKGHGIHSPFVFDFIRKVILDKTQYPDYGRIEAVRRQLLKDDRVLIVEDLGAGSSSIRSNERKLSAIARSSLKSPKYAQLLYRVVQHYRPKTILELGTSLGMTTAYLAAADTTSKVYTLEGSAAIAEAARASFTALQIPNIKQVEGDFNLSLPSLLEKCKIIDLAFIDGNHRKEPTLDYFGRLLEHAGPHSILVFDDIHWSAGMEEAWQEICADPRVTLTIDLFFMSFVFLNPDINHKQHFVIRF